MQELRTHRCEGGMPTDGLWEHVGELCLLHAAGGELLPISSCPQHARHRHRSHVTMSDLGTLMLDDCGPRVRVQWERKRGVGCPNISINNSYTTISSTMCKSEEAVSYIIFLANHNVISDNMSSTLGGFGCKFWGAFEEQLYTKSDDVINFTMTSSLPCHVNRQKPHFSLGDG